MNLFRMIETNIQQCERLFHIQNLLYHSWLIGIGCKPKKGRFLSLKYTINVFLDINFQIEIIIIFR